MTGRRRILVNVATVLSGVCCVLVIGLWVRSEFRHDDVGWRHGAGYRHLGSGLGRLMFDQIDQGRQPWAGHYWWGFQWYSQPDRPAAYSGRLWLVAVPYWFLLTISAPLPLVWVVRVCRARRR